MKAIQRSNIIFKTRVLIIESVRKQENPITFKRKTGSEEKIRRRKGEEKKIWKKTYLLDLEHQCYSMKQVGSRLQVSNQMYLVINICGGFLRQIMLYLTQL